MIEKNEDQILSEKEQEIIAVGASIASGCLPCTKFHLRAAAGVGADASEILQAVEEATRVRITATGLMAKAGGLSPAGLAMTIPDPTAGTSLIRELAAIAAAFAVSCSTTLEAHMKAARALGATDKQLLAAIQIACAVGRVARQRAQASAGSILGLSEKEAAAWECGEEQGGGENDCHCRPGDDGPTDQD